MTEAANPQAVTLPPAVRELLLLGIPEGELNHWALEAILAEAARTHMVSRRKAATLLGLVNYKEREAFFERHSLTNEYTVDMVHEDFRTIEALEAKRRNG